MQTPTFHFCYAQQAARQHFCSSDYENCAELNFAYVIGSQFDGPEQRLSDDEICFDSDTDPWNGGDESLPECTDQTFSSFTILDNIFSKFSNSSNYPNLKKIVAAGHSGGGQTIGRYALGSDVEEKFNKKGIEFMFLVANPSTSVYLDKTRPIIENDNKCDNLTIPDQIYYFYDASEDFSLEVTCPEFNQWKYGLDNVNVYMTSGESLATKIDSFGRKHMLFVGGQADHCCSCTGEDSPYCCECKSGSLDGTCSAELMGRHSDAERGVC